MADDFYSLLGIDRHAPEREIKKAYHRLARELHPDKAKTPEDARKNAERLAGISRAYNTLKDPEKRTAYDSGRPTHGTSQSPSSRQTSAPKSSAPPAAASSTPSAAGPAGSSAARMARGDQKPQASPQPKFSQNDMAAQKVLTAQKAFVKGMEFYKNQDFKGALPFFEAAASNDPESEPQYHMKLAVCLLRTKGSFTRAVEAAEKACEMDTYNVEFKFILGEIYETVGVKSKAKKVYEDVLNWEPENEKAKLKLNLMSASEPKKKSVGGNILATLFPSIFGKK